MPVVGSPPRPDQRGPHMDKPQNRAEDVALFRFTVIAPPVNPPLAPAPPGALARQSLLAQPTIFGRYEAPRPNARWIGDFLVGPWVPYPKTPRSRRAKLILFVDDCSRLLVHGVWSFEETTRIAQLTLKAAILRRGVPETLSDPGGLLRSEEHTSELQSHLNLVCRLLLEKKKNMHHRTQHPHAAH